MKKDNFIKYLGTETEFFKRQCVDQFDADTVLVVPDTHSAVVVKDGQMMTTLDSGSHKIFDTKRSFFGIKKKTESYTVDVIYMSKTYELAVGWGTTSMCVLKDYLTNLNVKVGLRGEFRVIVGNPRQFYLKLIGPRQQYDVEALRNDLSARLRGNLQDVFSDVVEKGHIHVLDIPTKEREISKAALPILNKLIYDNYGLTMISFDVLGCKFDDNDVAAVQDFIKNREDEVKERERKEEEKREAREIAAEIERLDDKQFERGLLLKELESKDYEKYLEVMKLLAQRNSSYLKVEKGTSERANTSRGAAYCPKCGHSYENGDAFCPGCGARVGGTEIKCPKCGKINKDAAFCSGCGTKL